MKTEFRAKLWGGCARTWDMREENDEKLVFRGFILASGTGFLCLRPLTHLWFEI